MARTPTVAAERIHRTWTSPAYVFPAKLVRTVRTGPRRKSSPELAGRRWPDRQPWRPRGFTAHDHRRPMFFPANMVTSVRKGPRWKSSPDLAGPPRSGGGRIIPRPYGVAAERNHRTWPSLAYKF